MKFPLPALALLAALALTGCNSDQPATTADQPAVAPVPPANTRRILFFGNSLTAGMGLDPEEAFPALIGQKIDSARLGYTVINAGLSGETTAGGRSRIGWVLRQPVEFFILELGANDGLRGLPLADTRRNLQAIIDTVKKKSPQAQIILAGMQMPPNLGKAYAKDFQSIYPELAQKNNAVLIPFLLEGVAGHVELNQKDGIHPTAKGDRIIAKTVWGVLLPLLKKA
ncbi:arylesterase [Hymenobacter sp. ASUV-10]|uniref:Arylesterase n=1 Tax=Hymenobacter aranciens TaxID=3063996 RepID=A0ABT9BD99_9BACT|nr:arylesterase [Hymenobacter sp. ASUV-10]MDO7876232.1 arylesterase [Hymenobacter sp. ASUV-10]